jgi:hypothetical protein
MREEEVAQAVGDDADECSGRELPVSGNHDA